MSRAVVFDIETYRRDWNLPLARREAFDPARNTIITAGIFDGRNVTILPIIENLTQENGLVSSFLDILNKAGGSILAGYNILHFDIPHIVYKLNLAGKVADLARFKPLDLYWTLPYWLRNSSAGIGFAQNFPQLGKLWRFEDVVKKILKLEANPFPNRDVPCLWETKRFAEIERHLERDLIDTYSLLELPTIKEAMDQVRKSEKSEERCGEMCPFRRPLQKTSERAVYYCALLQKEVSSDVMLSAVDVIDFPLPKRDVSWLPSCRN